MHRLQKETRHEDERQQAEKRRVLSPVLHDSLLDIAPIRRHRDAGDGQHTEKIRREFRKKEAQALIDRQPEIRPQHNHGRGQSQEAETGKEEGMHDAGIAFL